MSQVFDAAGRVVPVTVIEATPNVVVQLRTQEKDGYSAVQVGIGSKKRTSKAMKGHMKDLGIFQVLKEFEGTKSGDTDLKVGDTIKVDIFAAGDMVRVSGLTKGKGFQGAVKRHGFHGMPASHGAHSVLRHIGSIGQRFPQHTLKGKRMAGHMGNVRATIRGLKVMLVDSENNLLAVKGAVPGNNGAPLEVRTH